MKRKKRKKIVVVVSGGFDPIHVGHVRLFEAAKKLGTELVVILNNDNWLTKKKGKIFMRQSEREEIIGALRPVDRVVFTSHEPDPADMSICKELQRLKPDIFANGGDRNKQNAADSSSSLNSEQELCHTLGIRMKFNVGRGGKVQSSSWLLGTYAKALSQKRTKAVNG